MTESEGRIPKDDVARGGSTAENEFQKSKYKLRAQ